MYSFTAYFHQRHGYTSLEKSNFWEKLQIKKPERTVGCQKPDPPTGENQYTSFINCSLILPQPFQASFNIFPSLLGSHAASIQ